jgi:phospholipid-translocating ATPase
MGTCGAVIIFFTMWSLYGLARVNPSDNDFQDLELHVDDDDARRVG